MSELDREDVAPGSHVGPLSRVLAPIRGALLGAALLAALGAALVQVPLAGIAYIAQLALGQANGSQSSHQLWQVLGLSLLALLLGMALSLLGEMLAHLADSRITGHLRLAMTRHLAKVPLGWFTARSSGEVKQAMQDDISTLHSLTAHFFTAVGRGVGAVSVSVVYLLAVDWRLALLSLLPFPLFFLFVARAHEASAANMHSFAGGMARINNAAAEFVNGIPVVKTFGGERKVHANYRDAVDSFAGEFVEFTRPLVKAMANANALMAPVSVLGVVLLFGALFVAQGWLQPSEILPFALVAPGLCAPLLLLSYLTHDLHHAKAAAQRVHALLQTPLLVGPAHSGTRAPQGTEICVEHLSYGYESQTPVLSDISFKLSRGQVTAVVGTSGAGKSTLARLLLRFFDPCVGCITLGGVDLRDLESSQLYRHIGFVLQEVRLIQASVRDNIALGRPGAGLHEIESAARIAQIHDRILALPRGYESVIGEDAQLSGGEQQRLSIARAVLLDPPVLIFDEATAASDAENEVRLQQALSLFAQGRSLLVIAHRLDTVMHADQILVIDQGRIVERGRHQDLLERGGLYSRLWLKGGYAGEGARPDASPIVDSMRGACKHDELSAVTTQC